jgi:hypothetical protein
MHDKDSYTSSRRQTLKCVAFSGVGTLFGLAGGVLTPVNLALAAEHKGAGTLRRTRSLHRVTVRTQGR